MEEKTRNKFCAVKYLGGTLASKPAQRMYVCFLQNNSSGEIRVL